MKALFIVKDLPDGTEGLHNALWLRKRFSLRILPSRLPSLCWPMQCMPQKRGKKHQTAITI